MDELTKIPNIGRVLAGQLNEVGIATPQQLKEAGGKQAWLRILAADPSACINRLYALEGAVRGIRWHNLPKETKKDLKDFYIKVKTNNKSKIN